MIIKAGQSQDQQGEWGSCRPKSADDGIPVFRPTDSRPRKSPFPLESEGRKMGSVSALRQKEFSLPQRRMNTAPLSLVFFSL